jgi:hypothetical protein
LLPATKTFLEALNTTSFVDDFVVASEERVTSVADVSADGWYRCTSCEFVAAATADVTVDVVRVDIFFHGNDQGFGCENLAGHDEFCYFLSISRLLLGFDGCSCSKVRMDFLMAERIFFAFGCEF